MSARSEKQRARYAADLEYRERKKARERAYREANRERMREQDRARRANNPEQAARFNARNLARYYANPWKYKGADTADGHEMYLERKRLWERERRAALRSSRGQ